MGESISAVSAEIGGNNDQNDDVTSSWGCTNDFERTDFNWYNVKQGVERGGGREGRG